MSACVRRMRSVSQMVGGVAQGLGIAEDWPDWITTVGVMSPDQRGAPGDSGVAISSSK